MAYSIDDITKGLDALTTDALKVQAQIAGSKQQASYLSQSALASAGAAPAPASSDGESAWVLPIAVILGGYVLSRVL